MLETILGLVLSSAAVPPAVVVPAAPGTMSGRSVLEVVTTIADHQLRDLADGEYRTASWAEVTTNKAPVGINWVYPWGVNLTGMLRAAEATGDQRYSAFVVRHNEIMARYWAYLFAVRETYGADHAAEVRALVDGSPIRRLMRLGSLDNAGAMSAQMVEAFVSHGGKPTAEEQKLLALTTDWVANRQSRLPDGTFWRPETNETLWVDDLYMANSLLTRWYEFTRDPKYLDDAARQVLGMAALQQEPDGLFFHARHIAEQKPAPFKWGRANGWVAVATAEVLSLLPEGHPSRAKVLDVFRRQISGIKRVQAPSGLWRQVLDHEELWEETSCSAMFTFAIARGVRKGFLPKEDLAVARKAFVGISGRVTSVGGVEGTSEGTLIGRDLQYYVDRKRPTNDQHAPGPVLVAGAELLLAEKALAGK